MPEQFDLASYTFNEAEKTSTKPTVKVDAPKAATPEAQLLAAGWKNIHATTFWRSPDGQAFPTASYALQMLKAQHATPSEKIIVNVDNLADVIKEVVKAQVQDKV